MSLCNFCQRSGQRCITCVFNSVGRITVETPTAVNVAFGESRKWRPYVSGFLNFANRTSQATRVQHVGSTSQLFRIFREESVDGVRDLQDWRRFYVNATVNEAGQCGEAAIKTAGAKLFAKVDQILRELKHITPADCEDYVRDLIINKSFIGHGIEEAALRKIAEKTNRVFTPSTIEDERKGIDGYLDEEPVSVKPASYRLDEHPQDVLPAKVYYYALSENDVTLEQLRSIAANYDIRFTQSSVTKKQMWDTLIGTGNIFFWEQ